MERVKIFVSYSNEDQTHKEQVQIFADLLDSQNYDVTIDSKCIYKSQNDINQFMYEGITNADVIVTICSPSFKAKVDNPNGSGVSNEARLINDIIKKQSKPVVPIILSHIKSPEEEIIPTLYSPNLRIKFDLNSYFDGLSQLKNIIASNFPDKAWQYVDAKSNYITLLEDLNFAHSGNRIDLSQVFVYPLLACIDIDDSKRIHRVTAETIIEHNGVYLISGKAQHGKSAYARKLCLDLINDKRIPIYFHYQGSNVPVNILKLLNEQYTYVPNYPDDPRKHLVLIIDDFHKLPNSTQKKLANTFSEYQSVILFTDDAYQFDLKSISELNTFKQYIIKEFSPSLRGELTRKWIEATNPDLDENQLAYIEDEKLALLDKTLGKFHARGIVPSTPFFILNIISTSSGMDVIKQRNITSQGHCYQALIFLSLQSLGLKPADIDSYINFLTTFAYYLYEDASTEVTEEQMISFITKYRTEYNLSSTDEQLLNNLIKANLITRSLGKYRFFYPYIFYYFIGKYFSENTKDCLANIQEIVQNLYMEKNSYICIFLIHHSKEEILLERIIEVSNKYFSDYSAATLVNHELMLCGDSRSPAIAAVLPEVNKGYSENRKNRLEQLDVFENNNCDCSPDEDYYYLEETEDTDNIEYKEIKGAFHTAEVIGTVVRNRAGSLPKEKIENLILQGMNIILRLLSKLLTVLTREEDREIIVKILIEKMSERTGKGTQDFKLIDDAELRKTAEELPNSLGYGMLLGLINAEVVLLGSKEVTTNLNVVCNNANTPATLIIKHLNKMRNANTVDLKEMKSDMSKSSFCYITERILKFFVIEHCAFRPIKHSELQRISSNLNIDLGKLTQKRKSE